MRTSTSRLATALAVAAALGACAGDGEGRGDGAGSGDTAPQATAPVQLEGEVELNGVADLTASGSAAAVELSLDDDEFSPTFVKAAPGAEVAVSLANRGDRAHTFTIESLGIDHELPPGATASVDVALPATGVVRFACRFHESGGMQGAFYFTDGETAAGDY